MHPHHILARGRVVDDFGSFDVGSIQFNSRFLGQHVVAEFPIDEIGRSVTRHREERAIGISIFAKPVVVPANLDDAAAMGLDGIPRCVGPLQALVQHASCRPTTAGHAARGAPAAYQASAPAATAGRASAAARPGPATAGFAAAGPANADGCAASSAAAHHASAASAATAGRASAAATPPGPADTSSSVASSADARGPTSCSALRGAIDSTITRGGGSTSVAARPAATYGGPSGSRILAGIPTHLVAARGRAACPAG